MAYLLRGGKKSTHRTASFQYVAETLFFDPNEPYAFSSIEPKIIREVGPVDRLAFFHG